jgi:hypothetical protein
MVEEEVEQHVEDRVLELREFLEEVGAVSRLGHQERDCKGEEEQHEPPLEGRGHRRARPQSHGAHHHDGQEPDEHEVHQVQPLQVQHHAVMLLVWHVQDHRREGEVERAHRERPPAGGAPCPSRWARAHIS